MLQILFLLLLVFACLLWWKRKPAYRQDILEKAEADLEDAKVARKVKRIQQETNEILEEIE